MKTKITFIVKGMHCKSCEMLVKDALLELGVLGCEIDFKSGKAAVTFDSSKLNPGAIKSEVEKQGYKVE